MGWLNYKRHLAMRERTMTEFGYYGYAMSTEVGVAVTVAEHQWTTTTVTVGRGNDPTGYEFDSFLLGRPNPFSRSGHLMRSFQDHRVARHNAWRDMSRDLDSYCELVCDCYECAWSDWQVALRYDSSATEPHPAWFVAESHHDEAAAGS